MYFCITAFNSSPTGYYCSYTNPTTVHMTNMKLWMMKDYLRLKWQKSWKNHERLHCSCGLSDPSLPACMYQEHWSRGHFSKWVLILLEFRDLQVNRICFPCGVAVSTLGQGVFTSSTTVYRVNH